MVSIFNRVVSGKLIQDSSVTVSGRADMISIWWENSSSKASNKVSSKLKPLTGGQIDSYRVSLLITNGNIFFLRNQD